MFVIFYFPEMLFFLLQIQNPFFIVKKMNKKPTFPAFELVIFNKTLISSCPFSAALYAKVTKDSCMHQKTQNKHNRIYLRPSSFVHN